MKTDFKLVGITKPRSATLEFLHTDAETFWSVFDMPDERVDALFKFMEGNWKTPMIAEVEHEGFYEDGTPTKPNKVIAVREL